MITSVATALLTLLVVGAVILAVGGAGSSDERVPGTEREAIAGCQQLSRSKLANPGSASYSETEYKTSKDYRSRKWEVVGSAVAIDTSGVVRPFTYACVGAYPGPDGNWYADSMVNS
ncbi:hypothetical protein [Actinomycetospora termitidis]|uniref:Secreted protein n=1 Tax=Actinomycetospora termitidis TaxID=3053470 RepID=A0ABT7MF37_9PSEU|nr:hypothetical protein [Actinomycetospora sp. Odt1-22]MDL5159274.1 hypothetical protein [Actinomycetospora sp. Odt1-22]